MNNSENVNAEQSLRDKLKEIGNPIEGAVLSVQLTKEEALLYEVDLNDVMDDKELIIESEGTYE